MLAVAPHPMGTFIVASPTRGEDSSGGGGILLLLLVQTYASEAADLGNATVHIKLVRPYARFASDAVLNSLVSGRDVACVRSSATHSHLSPSLYAFHNACVPPTFGVQS